MKQCSTCKLIKSFDQYRKDKSKRDGYASRCRSCASLREKEYYQAIHKKTRSQQGKERRAKFYELINDHKQGGCLVCKEPEAICLAFHHLDPLKKDVTIASMHSNSIQKVLDEIEKCIVVCHNCHAKIHAGIITL